MLSNIHGTQIKELNYVACCPLVSHGEHDDGTERQTEGRTPVRYVTLSAKRGRRNNSHDIFFDIAEA